MNNFPFARVKKKKKKNYVKSSKASLRIKKSPVQRKNQKGDISGGFSFETHDSKKKERKARCLQEKHTHTHEPTHTLSFKRVGCTTFPTSLDGAAEVAEPRSPAERPCAAAAAAAGCGFFFFTPRLPLVPPGVLAPWSSLHSTSHHLTLHVKNTWPP